MKVSAGSSPRICGQLDLAQMWTLAVENIQSNNVLKEMSNGLLNPRNKVSTRSGSGAKSNFNAIRGVSTPVPSKQFSC